MSYFILFFKHSHILWSNKSHNYILKYQILPIYRAPCKQVWLFILHLLKFCIEDLFLERILQWKEIFHNLSTKGWRTSKVIDIHICVHVQANLCRYLLIVREFLHIILKIMQVKHSSHVIKWQLNHKIKPLTWISYSKWQTAKEMEKKIRKEEENNFRFNKPFIEYKIPLLSNVTEFSNLTVMNTFWKF